MIITIVGAFTGAMMTRPTSAQLAANRETGSMPIVGSHTVGAPDGGPGMPGTGWSTGHGDLRVPHFLGLHALQLLALLAFAIRRPRWSETAQVRLITTAAASYFALYCMLLAQAFRGQPLVSQDALSIAMFVVWGAATTAAAWMSVAHLKPLATLETI
jgi:hypothetical protein